MKFFLQLRLSRYHLIVIAIYVFLVLFLLKFSPYKFYYGYEGGFFPASIAAVSAAFCLYFVHKPVKIFVSDLGAAIIYGMLFAVPEEIIFRGVIQSFLFGYFKNIGIAVLLSSLVFGLAHLANGAKSLNISGWNWQFAALAFFSGLPLGLIFALTGNLLIPTILHIFFVASARLYK